MSISFHQQHYNALHNCNLQYLLYLQKSLKFQSYIIIFQSISYRHFFPIIYAYIAFPDLIRGTTYYLWKQKPFPLNAPIGIKNSLLVAIIKNNTSKRLSVIIKGLFISCSVGWAQADWKLP